MIQKTGGNAETIAARNRSWEGAPHVITRYWSFLGRL